MHVKLTLHYFGKLNNFILFIMLNFIIKLINDILFIFLDDYASNYLFKKQTDLSIFFSRFHNQCFLIKLLQVLLSFKKVKFR